MHDDDGEAIPLGDLINSMDKGRQHVSQAIYPMGNQSPIKVGQGLISGSENRQLTDEKAFVSSPKKSPKKVCSRLKKPTPIKKLGQSPNNMTIEVDE